VCLRDLDAMCELAFMRRHAVGNTSGFADEIEKALMERLRIMVGEQDQIGGPPLTVRDGQDELLRQLEIEAIQGIGRSSPSAPRGRVSAERWGSSKIDVKGTSVNLVSALHAANYDRIYNYDVAVDRIQLQAAMPAGETNIAPTVPQPQAAMPQVRKINAKVDTEAWYKSRIAGWAGPPPSREEDQAAGAEFGLSSRRVNALRREHAPEEWQTKGRRRSLKQ
jgi:hypothetical protein